MLPKFRSFVRPIIRSFVRSFIVPIHRSFIVPIHRSYDYSPSLFTVTIHHYYSLTLFTIDTIQYYYSSSLLFITVTTHRWCLVTFSSSLFIVTIHCYYSLISRSPQISTTHTSCCPVHLRPARPIFQSYELRWLWFSFQWELPIWSPILGFSKLSTLNFEIPSNQAPKLRFQ
jgi:hypothetical protein